MHRYCSQADRELCTCLLARIVPSAGQALTSPLTTAGSVRSIAYLPTPCSYQYVPTGGQIMGAAPAAPFQSRGGSCRPTKPTASIVYYRGPLQFAPHSIRPILRNETAARQTASLLFESYAEHSPTFWHLLITDQQHPKLVKLHRPILLNADSSQSYANPCGLQGFSIPMGVCRRKSHSEGSEAPCSAILAMQDA